MRGQGDATEEPLRLAGSHQTVVPGLSYKIILAPPVEMAGAGAITAKRGLVRMDKVVFHDDD